MRGQRRNSGFEQDAFTRWRHLLAYMQRAGVRKQAKRISHKKDRQVGRAETRDL